MRALYEAHAESAFRLTLRLVRQRADAEEIVQDAFITAFEKLDQLRDDQAFGRWLSSICVNRAKRTLRRRRLLAFIGLEDVGETSGAGLMSTDTPPEESALLGEIDRALCGVPAAHRVAWILRHVEGHELEVVAALSDCSLATVKRWLLSTNHHLQKRFGPFALAGGQAS